MKPTNNNLNEYYGKNGTYLQEHEAFLKTANVDADTNFIGKALDLNYTDVILDIACGQGRHAHALSQKGYHVDGVDFSEYLVGLARAGADNGLKRPPEFMVASVMDLSFPSRYTKAYWFFSDLASIDLAQAVMSISGCLEKNGSLLLDTDNVFRILSYLQKTPDSQFTFDVERMELVDAKRDLRVPYPVIPMWKYWMERTDCCIEAVYGDYAFGTYSLQSPRLILLVRKNASTFAR